MKNIKLLFSGILALAIITGCSDWTEIKSIEDTDLNATLKSDEYYAALREWKKTPGLPQVFVWFDNWTGVAPAGDNSLRGLPDSLSIASNWGGHPKFELSEDRKADMEYVQKVKGTKVVVTLFSKKVGDDVPWNDLYDVTTSSPEEDIRKAIAHYAETLHDLIVLNGYDGYDWDYEPGYDGSSLTDHLWYNATFSRIFVEELSYWFGNGASDPTRDRGGRKAAHPGLMLLIDGAIGVGNYGSHVKQWPLHYVDYIVLQAYGASSTSQRSRVNGVLDVMSPWIDAGILTREETISRIILTENFESYGNSGGYFLSMSQYIHVADDVQIGGCGLYRSQFDYNQGKGEYNGSPEYWFLRQGITNIYRIFYERLNASEDNQ